MRRGDIVVFHHPDPHFLVKRIVGLPGDHLKVIGGRVSINGQLQDEPYAAFDPVRRSQVQDIFPASIYSDPQVDPEWWHQMQNLTSNGELTIPTGEYFVMGDNRNHSRDSRYWGFVDRREIVASPLMIYFSVRRPASSETQRAADDRLGLDRELPARLTGFARWKRIFQVVH